jgi:hypothetical protein
LKLALVENDNKLFKEIKFLKRATPTMPKYTMNASNFLRSKRRTYFVLTRLVAVMREGEIDLVNILLTNKP